MVTQEQPDENEQRFETSATVSRRDQASNSRRRSHDESDDQPGVRPASNQSHAVLPVGTHRRPRLGRSLNRGFFVLMVDLFSTVVLSTRRGANRWLFGLVAGLV